MTGTIPQLQFRSNCIIGYDLPVRDSYSSFQYRHNNLLQLTRDRKKAYTGTLTPNTMKRLTKAIDLLVQISKPTWGYNEVTKQYTRHTLSFITLTISKQTNVSIHEAYEKVFKHFLQWLRRTAGVTTYVWKVELQQRGQVHYHITTPSFINCHTLRKKWNSLQQAAGYTADYYQLKGHHDPNSTDIHEVRKVKDISNYMKKEFCKSIQNHQLYVSQSKHTNRLSPANIIESNYKQKSKSFQLFMHPGKVWDCSQNLKMYNYFTIEETNQQSEVMKLFQKSGDIVLTNAERCSVYKIIKGKSTDLLYPKQRLEYELLIDIIRMWRN